MPLPNYADYDALAARHQALVAMGSPMACGPAGCCSPMAACSPVACSPLAYARSPMKGPMPVAGPCSPNACPPPTLSCFTGGCGDPVIPSGSAHQFESNFPAGETEQMCGREVEYVTELVQVPVQRPIVLEKISRTREIPTEHIITVRNHPICNPNVSYCQCPGC